MTQAPFSTVTQALSWAVLMLSDCRDAAHGDAAHWDAQLLLQAVLGCDRVALWTQGQRQLGTSEKDQFYQWVLRRSAQEPIAYLLGDCPFFGLTLTVNQNALIPRPETEWLVENLLRCYQDAQRETRFLDLGTGSGAIALAIAQHCPKARVVGVDRCEQALQVAADNGAKLAINNVTWIQSHWAEALVRQPSFDVIVSNPPYLRSGDPHLSGSIRYEPEQALVAGETGLEALTVIAQQAKELLLPQGSLWLEHGFDQGEATAQLLMALDYERVITHQDLAGLDRFTVGYKPVLHEPTVR